MFGRSLNGVVNPSGIKGNLKKVKVFDLPHFTPSIDIKNSPVYYRARVYRDVVKYEKSYIVTDRKFILDEITQVSLSAGCTWLM